jgi:hypothetical protein
MQKEQILIQEFKALRVLQKSYFKSRYDDPSRSQDLLTQSKIQEKKVDQLIEEYYKPKNTLF